MSFGIALSGGGTKGAAHVGVLLALEEEGLTPSSIAGTSAGSIAAGLYATGTSPKQLKEIVVEMSKSGLSYVDIDIKELLRVIPKLIFHQKFDFTGFIKGNALEKFLYEQTGAKNIRDTGIRTIIPAVDLNSGDTIAYTNTLNDLTEINHVKWKSNINICEAMRASSAVPAVFAPKLIDDMILVDGGVSDVLPVDLLIGAGEENILAVDVGESYKIPEKVNIIEITAHSLSIMGTRLKEYHGYCGKLLLKPDLPETSGLLTFDNMIECMNAGYKAVKENITTIKEIFS